MSFFLSPPIRSSNTRVSIYRLQRTAVLPVKLIKNGIAVSGVLPSDIEGPVVNLYFNNGEIVPITLDSSNWIPSTASNGEPLYTILIPGTEFILARKGPFQWSVTPSGGDPVANAFDGSGFVGFGVLDDFQDAAEHPSRDILAAATRQGVRGTIGFGVRLLHNFFGGRVKLDQGTNQRTVYDETNAGALTVGNTFDNTGTPSVDPVFETVVAPDTSIPTILSRSPNSGATGIAVNTLITVQFSEAMDPATINSTSIQLLNGVTPVECDIKYLNNIITLVPVQVLAGTTTFTVQISTSMKDTAGNSIASTTWNFTTV